MSGSGDDGGHCQHAVAALRDELMQLLEKMDSLGLEMGAVHVQMAIDSIGLMLGDDICAASQARRGPA